MLIGAPTDSNERMCFFYNEGHKIMNDKPPSVAMNDPFEVPKRMKQFIIYDRLTALIPTAPTVGYSKDTNNTYVLISISYYYNKLRRLSLLFYLKKVY